MGIYGSVHLVELCEIWQVCWSFIDVPLFSIPIHNFFICFTASHVHRACAPRFKIKIFF